MTDKFANRRMVEIIVDPIVHPDREEPHNDDNQEGQPENGGGVGVEELVVVALA